MRGKLIVIEGNDGSGKATQAALLVEKLKSKGIPAKYFEIPAYNTPTGKIISDFLNGKFGNPTKIAPEVAAKHYSDNRKEIAPEIKKSLENGLWIVMDRYLYSNFAYQGAKISEYKNRVRFYRQQEQIEFFQNKIPKPDLTIFLSVPVEISQELMEREGRIKDRQEKEVEYLLKVNKIYEELLGLYNMKVVECVKGEEMRTKEEIANKVFGIVSESVDIEL